MASIDITQKNIEKIGVLFPNVITEMRDVNGNLRQGINFELLKQELSGDIVRGEECYKFTWVGKKAAIIEGNTPIQKTLRPCIEESKNFKSTGNLYLEGDNLDVLKLLQNSYCNSIDMIYIDPPYNTGNDFIYKDNFKNTHSNGKFHSDWCSMLYPRLKLARNLLSDSGVILINIDENEIANLQKMCSEIFGELNDVGTIIWDKRNPKGDARGVSCQHEYIVIFARNKKIFLKNNSIQRPKQNAGIIIKKAIQFFSKINDDYTLKNANKDFALWINSQHNLSGGEKAYCKIDDKGDVYRAVSMAWPNKKKAPDDYFIPLIHPVTNKPCPLPKRGWRNPSATMQELLRKNLILFGKDETIQPNRKYLLKENMCEKIPSLLYYGGSDVNLLSELKIPFDTPKVINVCKEHIRSFMNTNGIILDFFSGSATTAHAVMQLNAEDSGTRKFIMVQLPEMIDEKSEAYQLGYKNISEIGMERIRRAGEKIKENNKDKDSINDLDIGFRVLKVDSANMAEVEPNIKEDRTDIDLLYGVLLDWGLPLSLRHKMEKISGVTVHTVAENVLTACFAEKIPESVVQEIAMRQPTRVVFRNSSIAKHLGKIDVEEIFKLLAPNTIVKGI